MEQILTINDSAGPTPPNWATFSGTGPLLRVSIGCAAGLTIGQADEDRLRRWLVQREVARAQEMPERVRAALMRGVAQHYEGQPW